MRMIPKITLLILLLVLALQLTGAVSASLQRRGQARAKSFPEQADEQAHAFWNSKITRCGADSYTLDRNYIHEFKGVAISVTATNVSGADRLNGIEWRGFTTLTVQQSRTYSPAKTLYQNPGWSQWAQGFTSAMGGGELRADLRKEHGRWLVIPQLGQPAALKTIQCSAAADPAAFFRSANQAAFTAEVSTFKERAAQMGIYANNLSSELWTALYRVGNAGPNTAYATVNHVYLTANGGWLVCGRNGCAKDLSIPREISANRWVEQVTKDGGYLVFDSRPREGQPPPGYSPDRLPAGVTHQIDEYLLKHMYIKMVRVGYFGEWFILAGGESQCFGCPGRDEWAWSNLPPPGNQALKEIAADYNSQGIYDHTPIQDVAFIPNGGYLILYKDTYYGAGVPAEVLKIIDTLRASKRKVDQVTFGPNDSWIIRANGSW